MKHNEIDSVPFQIAITNLANLFNVYPDPRDSNVLAYSMNRTLNIIGLEDTLQDLFSVYTIKADDSWTIISYNTYGTTRLWWLVCKINQINDPTASLQTGARIKLLSKEVVDDILSNLRSS